MTIKKDANTSTNTLDTIKWLIVILLISGSIIGFYYFTEQSQLTRVLSFLSVIAIATFIASTTAKGRFTVDFLRATHLEVRKVVWPTRQETLQMTGIVLLMVVIVAVIIWGLDSFLFWMVRLFTGQGG
ncbi:MAG: preprotein translocase subunit SecE [Thiomargarita sp.]|nr:preprotein translocase subunit SecE [Thiomargarita sp.]